MLGLPNKKEMEIMAQNVFPTDKWENWWIAKYAGVDAGALEGEERPVESGETWRTNKGYFSTWHMDAIDTSAPGRVFNLYW